MTYRPRRAKQKPMQSHEIVGILPSEEADIQRALMASITKTTNENVVPQSSQKKVGRPCKLSTISKHHSPKSISSSPTSSSSVISFLSTSTDSLSSLAWTPSYRRSPRFKQKKLSGQKKLPRKTSSPSKLSPKNKNVTPKVKKLSPVNKVTPTKNKESTPDAGLKSMHTVNKPRLIKKTKLIACAVRKKPNVEEPRNEDGLTVDEILKSVAAQTKSLDQPLTKPNTLTTILSKLPLQQAKSSPSNKLPLKVVSPQKLKVQSPEVIDFESNTIAPEECQCTVVSVSEKNTSPDCHTPSSYLYQAQRKFASNQSPPARPVNQELASPLQLKETPKTEDFLRFLCLRATNILSLGSEMLPDCFKKFDLPWTPTTSVLDPNGHPPL